MSDSSDGLRTSSYHKPAKDFSALMEAFDRRIDSYIEDNGDGVMRNSHMNECKEQPSDTRVRDTLEKYVERCKARQSLWNGDFHTGEILSKMTLLAKEIAREEELDAVDRAIIVDFINYTGMTAGCDYALYTKDLDGSEWRQGR